MGFMNWRSCLLALLLITSFSEVFAKTYLTGKVVRIDSWRTTEFVIHIIYIQQEIRSYSVRVTKKRSYKLDWAVDDPIEFRLVKDAIYLRRPNGKEMKFPLLEPPTVRDSVPPETADLPFPHTSQQTVQPSRAVPEPARLGVRECAEIGAGGAQFGPLANACEYALSPTNLPNFVCQETVQRVTRSLSKSDWKNLDVVTAEVAFAKGRADRYSNFAINGHPVKLPPNVDGGPPLVKVLSKYGGWWSLGEFGTILGTVFNPSSQTSFKFNGNVDVPSGPSTAFGFHLNSASNFSYVLSIGDMHFHPGFEGSLWIDPNSGKLLRVEAYATDLVSSFPTIDYFEAINYGDVSISDVGTFLLPTAAEVLECDRPLDDEAQSSVGAVIIRGGMCYKNVLSFHDCRKFGAEAHIIPNTGDDH
jgi:hypothetical protein